MDASSESFCHQLSSYFKRTLDYEDKSKQEKARQCMNINQLKLKAQNKIISLGLDDSDFQDMFLLEILNWFKNEFFTWMDKPMCCICDGDTKSLGNVSPTATEELWGGHRVEDYECTKCSSHTRFPRYNDPGKLLETRTGRCGEWANCFVLCCRAAGFETRLILDFTDHLWAEVYSEKQQRWLHCDPCENVCDKPLLYESGWRKKLTYIIAFSLDNIQDVTWRYSRHHKELLKRRKSIDEGRLVRQICELRRKRFDELALSSKKINKILERTSIELVQLMSQSNSSAENLPGRTTGSLAWRMARGELGSGQHIKSIIFKPTPSELSNNRMNISYNCSEDKYIRHDGHKSEFIPNWSSQLFEAKEVFRKVEHDWKKAYICRVENSFVGTLTWKFDLSGTDRKFRSLRIFVGCQCYESGQIILKLMSNLGVETDVPQNEEKTFEEFQGSETICLTAILRGGNGANSWQHSQLFRQDLNSDEYSALRLEFTFDQ